MSLTKLTLQLFNAVPQSSKAAPNKAHVDLENGILIAPNACWAKSDIVAFVKDSKLSGKDLNKTWHKTWQEVIGDDNKNAVVQSVMGFLNGLGAKLDKEVRIPSETIGLEDLDLRMVVIGSMSNADIAERALQMLQSGMALKAQTIHDIFAVLEQVDYKFTGAENIRNKEAVVVLADKHGIYPKEPVEALRYAVYKATDSTTLIKSPGAIQAVRESGFDATSVFTGCGEERMAEVFNRFKPLFLAFKDKSKDARKSVNRISKLSKSKHKPLPVNALGEVTARQLNDSDLHWLKNATVFALFKALSACHTRLRGRTVFAYHIRNGKGWYKTASKIAAPYVVLQNNFDLIVEELKSRVTTEDHKVFIPEGVQYALPTSEKMFVGNVPTGTKFTAERLAAGIYWRNEWGANDLDLSTIDPLGTKVGWNSYYSGQNNNVAYSGDITNAPNGAVEYMNIQNGLSSPELLLNNVYNGNEDCEYKVIVGRGTEINKKYMMDPSQVWVEAMSQSIKRETIIGLFLPEDNGHVSFVMLNTAIGNANAASGSVHTAQFNKALVEQYSTQMTLNDLLEYVGFELTQTQNDATIDLSLDMLNRDTFVELFK